MGLFDVFHNFLRVFAWLFLFVACWCLVSLFVWYILQNWFGPQLDQLLKPNPVNEKPNALESVAIVGLFILQLPISIICWYVQKRYGHR